ncbi:hypothetical protein QJS04_geneDACA000932 [Acorus gramineus]|uniref:Uncharacterized protein n=1 Tax=Acorus gramineus TaxID=55184 RepID=A0AAV9ADZ3_ACOGR|nr:hypothetical protein QJS04_geneDACA000932 [Acorus gramineus]
MLVHSLSTRAFFFNCNRNLLYRQWCHKKGDWQGKRVHCETAGSRDGSVNGYGNYTCRRFLG